MLSKNLVKYVSVAQEETRIIDSNELLRRRREALGIVDPSGEEGQPGDLDGFVSGLGPTEHISLPPEGALSGNVIKAGEEAQAILEKAQEEAQALLAEAEAEAARLIDQSRDQARQEKDQVLDQARQQGFNEGMAQAQEQVDAMEREYLEKAQELEEIYQQQIDVLEPQFVDTITAIYEHFFHVELSANRDVLNYLISTAVHELEGSRNYIIHVSKEDYPYVTMQKKQILAGAVSGSCTVDVVEDLTLGKNECMIETDGGIFDCGLDTQLTELTRRLQLLSWTKEATYTADRQDL